MKQCPLSIITRRIAAIGCMLGFAFSISATDVTIVHAGGTGVVSVDNAVDPICGMKVSKVPKANTAQYKGKTIGFCSDYCHGQWDKLSTGEKDKKLAEAVPHQANESDKAEYLPLPKPGSKVPLGSDHYFIYGFTSPPKLGTAIMKVEIFMQNGQRDTTVHVTGDADMPSMRGAHSTGNKGFAISAKGFYLLPIQLVMPGDWEVRLGFEKDGQSLLRGAYLFDL